MPIKLADAPPDAWGQRFSLVVANILEGVVLQLRPSLCRALLPGGVLLLSGFTGAQAPLVRAGFGNELTVELQAHDDEWVIPQLRS